jgi:hypothetical protein
MFLRLLRAAKVKLDTNSLELDANCRAQHSTAQHQVCMLGHNALCYIATSLHALTPT